MEREQAGEWGGEGRRGDGGGGLRNWAPQSSSLIFVLLFDVFLRTLLGYWRTC